MNKKIMVAIQEEDKENLRSIAKSKGLVLSSFCRMVLLEKANEILRKNKGVKEGNGSE